MNEITNYYFLVIIVDFGKASKVMQLARELGATDGTVLLGSGTVKNNILSLLGLNESKKEIILMGVEESLDEYIHKELERKLHLNKANHGIVFSVPLKSIISKKIGKINMDTIKEGENDMKYEAIFTIVNKGVADEVIEAANKAGSTGATLIHGRGSNTEETRKLFNIDIEPEKDIILILSRIDNTEAIVDSIKHSIDVEKDGNGIIFVLDVSRATGLYKSE